MRLFCSWLIELHVIAVVYAFVLLALDREISGHLAFADVRDAFAFTLGILSFFWIFGFGEVTLIARMALSGRLVALYPILASLIFLAHLEVMNRMVRNGGFPQHTLWKMRIAGVTIVFLITATSTWLQRRYWIVTWGYGARPNHGVPGS
jgi:hypothetical protein